MRIGFFNCINLSGFCWLTAMAHSARFDSMNAFSRWLSDQHLLEFVLQVNYIAIAREKCVLPTAIIFCP